MTSGWTDKSCDISEWVYRSAHTNMAYGQLSYSMLTISMAHGQLSYSMLTISIVGGVQMTPLFYGIYFIFYGICEAWIRSFYVFRGMKLQILLD